MAYTVPPSAHTGQSLGLGGGTTSTPINTTGTKLIIIVIGWFTGVTADGTIDDSEHNTWTSLTKRAVSSSVATRLFYCINPTTNASHTFSYTGTTVAASIAVAAFANDGTPTFTSQDSGATASSATTLQPGSLTPGSNDCLVINALGQEDNTSGAVSINGGFTISDQTAAASGSNEGSALAYLLQTSAAASNPTWTLAGAANCAASQGVFSSTAGATLTGTVTTATESDIVAGGKTVILTLSGDTFVASGGTFDAQRQNIIDGMTAATSPATGWNNVVKALQGVSGVVRTSATVVTVTLDAQATYSISANEVITVTIPSTALTGAVALVATPTFTVTDVGGTTFGSLLSLSRNRLVQS